MTRRAFFFAIPAVAAAIKAAPAGGLQRVDSIEECRATPGTYAVGDSIVVRTLIGGNEIGRIVLRRRGAALVPVGRF